MVRSALCRVRHLAYPPVLPLFALLLALVWGASAAPAADMGPIRSGETRESTISESNLVDSWTFWGTAGRWAVLWTDVTSGNLVPWLRLYPPSGPVEWEGDEQLVVQLQQTGPYTILVSGEGGTYAMSFLLMPGPSSSPEDLDGGEIVPGQTLDGSMPQGDTDGYTFYGQAGDRVIIDAARTSGFLFVPRLTLHPPSGGPTEAAADENLDHVLQETGKYTVWVVSKWRPYSGTYAISLNKIPSALRPGLYSPRPADKATVRHSGGSLKWAAVAGATGYDVYFGTDVIAALDLIGDDVLSPTVAMPSLEAGTVYYWHVVAHTAGGDIDGPYWWFETGMGTDTIGLYDQTGGKFYLRNSNSGGAADSTFRFGPSAGSWLPVVGDWDSRTSQTIGLYNPTAGTFYLRNANAGGAADVTFRYGPAPSTWKPIAGDWDGDGVPGVGLYNAATGTFYLRSSLSAGPADYTFRFGPSASTWLPIVGDWNNDQTETVGLYNAANGTFYLRNALSGGAADLTFRFGPTPSSWKPMAGDWNADGTDSIGLYNAPTGTFYLRNSNTAGAADLTFRYGPAPSTWKPIAGDWDGQ